MISTKNYDQLQSPDNLRSTCKAISVLDAILCQQWEYRYYSYNSSWAENEEFCEMRNGEGDQVLLLFQENGCVINGFSHESDQQDKTKLTKTLPEQFNEFIFGEPVNSIGTTFCLWTTVTGTWQRGEIENYKDNSEELLNMFDGNPQTYIDWAKDYFDTIKDNNIPVETVRDLYNGLPLTKAMVLTIVEELEDWEQLEADLLEIDYPYNFN